MSKVSILVRRELASFFVSPIAYVVLAVFLLLAGLEFSFGAFFSESEQFVRNGMALLLYKMSIMLLFVAPLLTMRVLSEEINTGTIETLMTAPISNTAVVLSKFFGSWLFIIVMLLPTLAFPLILNFVAGSSAPDAGPIISGYFGLLLLAMAVSAVGVCISACVRSQITAAVASALVLTMLWWAGNAAAGKTAGSMWQAMQYLGIIYHYDSFARGLIDTRDVVYYVTLTALALFSGVGVVAVRRWR